MATATYTKSGTKAATPSKLDKSVFNVTAKNDELLKAAYVAYLANGRTNAARSKTRGLISGGGRKPWKQKGTGRARFGSSRNPIWRGGGVVFGPTGNENYTHKMNTGTKRQAIRQALSMAAADNKVIIIESIEAKDGKTAQAAKLLDKIGATGNILLAVDNKDDMIVRATANLPDVKLVQAKYLNVYDVMNADAVALSQKALAVVHEWLGGAK
ncbi:MAG TPA: 50S ribosomal protein L4 [Candidatus Saccharimonadales bacterium]|nr:50S ribosomal protein L4 [Candidatus Saccharimonadales bacterium]